MPSPFPGMDPYLEGELWTGFHHQLAVVADFQLVPKLPPGYFAVTEKYFVLDSEDDLAIAAEEFYPDVAIAASTAKSGRPRSRSALLAPVQVATILPHRVPHYRVVIRDSKNRKLVTIIEILSPTNKKSDGRREYLKKRSRILLSHVHLVEIDLLRKGQRVPSKAPLPRAPYFVFLSRVGQRPLMDVWPIQLQDPLPTIPIPLLGEDPDVPLDLQEALTTVYDRGGYAQMIDYRAPSDVPLSRAQQAWAMDRIKATRRAAR